MLAPLKPDWSAIADRITREAHLIDVAQGKAERFEVWTQPADDTTDLLCRDTITGELWLGRDGYYGRQALAAWIKFQLKGAA